MSDRLKVLVLSAEPPYPPSLGGARLRLFHLLEHLSRRHDITLVTLLESAEDRDYLVPLQSMCCKILAFDKPTPSASRLIDYFRSPSYRLMFNSDLADALTRELKDHHYDLAYVEGTHLTVYTACLGSVRKVLALCDTLTLRQRSLLSMATTASSWAKAAWGYYKIRRFERRQCQHYDATVVIAEREQKFMRRLCPTVPVLVVPNGVDSAFFQCGIGQEENPLLLVFTGTMDYLPNVDGIRWFVQEVLPRIQQQHPGTQLQIVGRNPSAAVQDLANAPGVSVVGYVADLRPYLAAAAVFVCPVRMGGGMKNKLLEAMAMRKAIVTTMEGINGIAGANGVEYRVADTAELFASAVGDLLQSPAVRQQLGQAARQIVEDRYSWERAAESLERVWNQVVH